MAGPPQLSDPTFKQFTEAGSIVDTGAAEIVEGVTKGAIIGVTEGSKSSLRKKVLAERKKLEDLLRTGIDPSESRLGAPTDLAGDELIDLSIENLLENTAADKTVDINVRELLAMDAEIQQTKRAVQQGIVPSRALEINVEKITRRFIDRFPGLAPEFQRTAQTALGTDSNLLSATMRTIREFESAQAAALTDIETVFKAATDAGFTQATFAATPEARIEAVAQFQAWSQRNAVQMLTEQREKIAISQGEITPAQRAFERRFTEIAYNTSLEVAATLAEALPLRLQSAGLAGMDNAIRSLEEGELQEVIFDLEQQKIQQIFKARNALANASYANEGTRARAEQLVETITDLFDNVIADVSGKRLSELSKTRLELLENFHGITFERLLGEDALFLKNILSLLPVDSRIQNLEFRNILEQGMMERIARMYGISDIAGAAFPPTGTFGDSGFDPSTAEGQGVLNLGHQGMIGAFNDFVRDPQAGEAASFQSSRIMNGFNIQFEGLEFETKKQLLDMIGTDKWDSYFEGAKGDVRVQNAAANLATKVVDWGAGQLNQAVEQLQRNVGSSDMTRKFGIFTIDPAVIKATGQVIRAPIITGDLVDIDRNQRGVVFTRRSNVELEKVGLEITGENIARVQRVVAALNANVANTLNVYARSMGNLGTLGSRDAILNEIFTSLVPRNVTEEAQEFPKVGTRGTEPGAAIRNPDGSLSSERTISVELDDTIHLIATIVPDDEGFLVKRSDEEAVELFRQGKNPSLGTFKTEAEATAASKKRSAAGGRFQ